MLSLDVAVLFGGRSGEAEVSRISANAVAQALLGRGHQVRLLELTTTVAKDLVEQRPDVVFPIAHGRLGEDGCVQGMLEVLELPYVGSEVRASAMAAHKPLAKRLWRAAALPVTPDLTVASRDDLDLAARTARERLGTALVIKPASGGSAIGIQRLASQASTADVLAALRAVLKTDSEALVEPWVSGIEVTCGVLQDDAGVSRALPPTLITPRRADFYDFASKYAPGGSEHRCPAPLDPELVRRIQSLAVRAHDEIGARDLSRTDFLVDETRGCSAAVTLLEINTLPGMTPTSLYPEAAAVAGVSFPELCDQLVTRAKARFAPSRPEVLPMPT